MQRQWKLTLITAGLVLSLVAVSCGSDADSGTSEPADSGTSEPADSGTSEPDVTGSVAAGPVQGGTLVFARQLETNTLNPFELSDNGQIYAHELIFDTLVFADPTGGPDIIPALAESWEKSDDGLAWTFTLRDNAKFSNGDAVTPEDIQFSLDRFADPDLNTILPSLALGYTGTEIVDDRTIIVRLDRPIAAFLENVSIFPAYIVPKTLLEEQGDAFWDNPVGSGPFKLKEWIRGTSISFEPNEFYWEEGKPYLDEVRYDFVVDDNTKSSSWTLARPMSSRAFRSRSSTPLKIKTVVT